MFTFSHSTTAISFKILLLFRILYLRNIYFKVSNYICIHNYTMNAVSFHYLWYGATLVYKRQYTDKTLTLRESMYMRASELNTFSHFHFLKVLFLSIFCWYFRYYVGTNDMLAGLNVPTIFQMYRQNSEKSFPPPPPPPSGYANDTNYSCM